MAGYPKNGKSGGFRSGGSSNRGFDREGDRDLRPRTTMHEAICSSCGKNCEVPFRPTGDKPVYCRECFSGAGVSNNAGRFNKKERRDFSPISSVPARTSSQAQNSEGGDSIKKELEALNSKLERLIFAVQALAHGQTPKEARMISPVKEEAVLKKAKKKIITKK